MAHGLTVTTTRCFASLRCPRRDGIGIIGRRNGSPRRRFDVSRKRQDGLLLRSESLRSRPSDFELEEGEMLSELFSPRPDGFEFRVALAEGRILEPKSLSETPVFIEDFSKSGHAHS